MAVAEVAVVAVAEVAVAVVGEVLGAPRRLGWPRRCRAWTRSW